MSPRTFEDGTMEHRRLVAVAKMLEALSPNNARYEVEDTFYDFGQEWKWTTICRKDYKCCQVLSPKEWEMIVSSTTIGDLSLATTEIRNGKYFGDN